ncbi:MAG TPA: nucleotide exchange factor GrpE [Acidimicrobiales bacterium]|nr:nucleotide exchange factor GrpE [Acidimicrobiales bacterium]
MANAPQDPEAREPTTPEATETDAAAAPEAAAAEGAGDAAASTEDATSTGDDEVVEGELEEEVTVETLLADLERVATERDQFLDAYRRAQADFENFKKQSQRRAEDEVQRRLAAFMEAFLPVLDACDAARQHGADAVEPIANALLLALEKEGLERVEPVGEPFDPNVAEAVVHEPGEGGEQVVAEVLRAGYLFNGRVLRPAMVRVTD